MRIVVANPDGALRPGMSATARVPLADAGSSILSVPAAALQRLADGWVVFLPLGEGSFAVRPVGRGRDLGGEVEAYQEVARRLGLLTDGTVSTVLDMDEHRKSRGK